MTRRLRLLTLTLAVLLAPVAMARGENIGEPGLVAYWSFDHLVDDQVPDLSGGEHLGKAHGVLAVRRGGGSALRFNGTDAMIDCGPGPELHDAVSVSVWMNPEVRPSGEPGIVMRHGPRTWGLSLYRDGRCYWYISGGGNSVSAAIGFGVWHHVVGTYDGKVSRLYIDGKLAGSKPLAVPIHQQGKLLIGMHEASREAFRGLIDEVKIYDRALSAEEIQAQFGAEARKMVVERDPIQPAAILHGDGFSVRVAAAGAMEVDIGDEAYFLEAAFSYRGQQIGFNHLTGDPSAESDPAWQPRVRQADRKTCTVTAAGTDYALKRIVRLEGHRIEVSDTITNRSAQPVGIMVDYRVISRQPEPEFIICGVPGSGGSAAEHPTVLVRQRQSELGAVAEDSLSRTQFEARASANRAGFGLRHLGLAAGRSVTLDSAYYPLGNGADYWTFLNRLRRDWKVNFRLVGPGNMFDVTRPDHWRTFTDVDLCRQYLKRNQLKILSLAPWIDYDNLDRRTGDLTSREQYKRITAAVKATVKAVDADVKILGDIEAPFVSLPRDVVEKIYDSLPENKRKGYHHFTEPQTAMLKSNPEAWARWSDSAVIDASGQMQFESYRRGKWPMIALTVRPVVGNGQHQYLMEQAKFVIEQCGLDGFYVDSFTGSKHWHYGYSYDRWDGVTVDIDGATGRIVRKYTDLALAGTESRRIFMQYGLDAGGLVVTNGHPIARETQAMPIHRFNESEWVIDIYQTRLGAEPPLHGRPCLAQLASPLALGVRPGRYGQEKAKAEYAQIIMRTAIHYLRHGVLYFHYGSQIPKTGPGAGQYGPINHMFPITPVELGPGFVIGEQRIVTAVSGTFKRHGPGQPDVRVFDVTGRPTEPSFDLRRSDDGWLLDLDLADWQQIAVIVGK